MEGEVAYLELLSKVLDKGYRRETRNGYTLELFGERMEFNLSDGSFPLLTTKKMFWRGIVEELLWFMRGSTDVKELQDKNVRIWDANSSRDFLDSVGMHHIPENTIGAGYGYQWRSFGGSYPNKDGFDQLRYVLKELIWNPSSRRIYMSAWNPKEMENTALMPCHISYNFYLGPNGLACQMYMRSNDLVAGSPFNIASTALFAYILAYIIDVPVDKVIICIGNVHIYEEHIEPAKIQIFREVMKMPTLEITKDRPFKNIKDMLNMDISSKEILDKIIVWIESLTYEDFVLHDYQSHSALKIKMIA